MQISFVSDIVSDNSLSLFDQANQHYTKGEFEKAIMLYDSINKSGFQSEELYYNMGNAYYKIKEIGKSILYYEKAKKLNPSNEDIAFNLALANEDTSDKLAIKNPMLLSQFLTRLVDLMSEKAWSILCITLFAFSLLFLLIYFISNYSRWKQIGFYVFMLLLICSFIVFFIAKTKYSKTLASGEAIILTSSVTVLGAPSDLGTKLFILHEGAKVAITDKIGDYSEISISSDKTGWVKTFVLGEI